MKPFAIARRGEPAYRSKTSRPAVAFRNRMSWAVGRRVAWSEVPGMMRRPYAFAGVPMPWREAFCGSRSAWLITPTKRTRRRSRYVCRWWYNGTEPAGAD